jgi:hypothetical protein
MGEFNGNPAPLTDEDFERAATSLGCTVAAVRAVSLVESKGGYYVDGRPKILFERHIFSRRTSGLFDASNPGISGRKPGGYKGGLAEYDRLAEAIACNREMALKSASWGAFQIMGFNHELAGFDDVESFVQAMVHGGEAAHLDAFVVFVKKNGLDDELVRKNWARFAQGYNGPNYAINEYDKKLAEAFAFFNKGGPRVDNPRPVLRMGDKGDWVVTLQKALKITADGDFGPGTKAAVVKFQKKAMLHADGIVGQKSWLKLLD